MKNVCGDRRKTSTEGKKTEMSETIYCPAEGSRGNARVDGKRQKRKRKRKEIAKAEGKRQKQKEKSKSRRKKAKAERKKAQMGVTTTHPNSKIRILKS